MPRQPKGAPKCSSKPPKPSPLRAAIAATLQIAPEMQSPETQANSLSQRQAALCVLALFSSPNRAERLQSLPPMFDLPVESLPPL